MKSAKGAFHFLLPPPAPTFLEAPSLLGEYVPRAHIRRTLFAQEAGRRRWVSRTRVKEKRCCAALFITLLS